jgi:hypothetical protein
MEQIAIKRYMIRGERDAGRRSQKGNTARSRKRGWKSTRWGIRRTVMNEGVEVENGRRNTPA